MKDKELIQALRCCVSSPKRDGCRSTCVFFNGDINWCIPEMGKAVSDRMEALLAENERLKAQMPKWISVEERLPETEDFALVTFTGWIGKREYIGGYLLAEYVHGDGWILEEYPQLENPNIAYWQPLPEPPSTEGVE